MSFLDGTIRKIKTFVETKGTQIATFTKDAISSTPKVLLYGAGGTAAVSRGYEMFNEDEELQE